MANTVKELMTPNPVVVDVGTQVREVAKLMERHDIGAVGVVREGRLFGVMTDRDIVLRAVAHDRDPGPIPAAELASPNAVTVPGDASLEDAERRMRERAVRRLFVVDDDSRPIGILSIDDVVAVRDPDSVAAHQIGEWGLGLSDQGYSD